MKEIQRHKITESKIGDASLIEHYQSKKEKAIARLSLGKNINFYALKDNYKRLVLYRHIQNIQQDPKPALINFLDLGLAHIKRTQTKTEYVQVNIFDREFKVISIEDDYGADFYHRYDLYNVAKLINSKKHLDILFQFEEPDSRKIRNPFWRTTYNYIKTAEMNQETERIDYFKKLKAISNTDVTTFIGLEGNSIIKQEGTKKIWETYHFPIIDLYEQIQQKNQDGFNERLEDYIISKKEDIIQTEKNDDSRNWIDFNLLGVLSTAKRNKMDIDLRTDYAPLELYTMMSST